MKKTIMSLMTTLVLGIVMQACGAERSDFRSVSVSAQDDDRDQRKDPVKDKGDDPIRDKMDKSAIEIFAACTGLDVNDVETDVEFTVEQANDFCPAADKISLQD